MRSVPTSRFWKCYADLPKEIQRKAGIAYQLWQINPHAHGLYFKRVSKKQPIYSVRITLDYRALGLLKGDAIVWFWIGNHEEYLRLLKQL
jgi:hypothetical protein